MGRDFMGIQYMEPGAHSGVVGAIGAPPPPRMLWEMPPSTINNKERAQRKEKRKKMGSYLFCRVWCFFFNKCVKG